MKSALPRDALLVLAGLATGCAIMGVSVPQVTPDGVSHTGFRGSAKPGIPVSVPGGPSTHSPSDVGEVLLAPAGLARARNFLNWLQRIDGKNWREQWSAFREAIKGREVARRDEIQQVLERIGEVAAQAGVDYFAGLELKSDTAVNTATVLSAWAASDPAAARKYIDQKPFNASHSGSFSWSLLPSLIQGTGRHSAASLKDFAADVNAATLHALGANIMEAALQRGSPKDGEEIWRKYMERLETAKGLRPDSRVFSTLLAWKVNSGTAGPDSAGETCAWLTSLVEEGYRVEEDSISFAVYNYGKTDPAGAFQWLCGIADRTQSDPDQSRRLVQRQGAVAHEWAKTDPEGLSRWLTAHPSQTGYEPGASALYHQLRDTDPAASAAWGQVVTDPDMKKYIK